MVVTLGVLYVYLVATGRVNIFAADFVTYYSSARLIVTGHGASIYNFAAINRTGSQVIYPFRPGLGGIGPFLYTPWLAVLIAPLALMPYTTAYALWVIFNLAVAVFSLAALARFAGLSKLTATLFVCLGLSSLPVFAALGQGQVSLIELALLVSVLLALQKEQNIAAGFLLSLVLIKPQYALPVFAVLLLRRRWRACAAFAVSAVLLAAVPLPLLGTGIESSYLHALVHFYGMHGHAAYLPAPTINYSLPGLIALFAPSYLSISAVFLVCISLMLTVWSALRSRTVEVPLALALAVTLLASPHVLIYDVSLLIIPVAVLLRCERSWAGLAIAVYAAPLAGLVLHLGVQLTVPMMALTAVALVCPTRGITLGAAELMTDMFSPEATSTGSGPHSRSSTAQPTEQLL